MCCWSDVEEEDTLDATACSRGFRLCEVKVRGFPLLLPKVFAPPALLLLLLPPPLPLPLPALVSLSSPLAAADVAAGADDDDMRCVCLCIIG